AAARAAATQFAALNTADGPTPVNLMSEDIVVGIYDPTTKTVVPTNVMPDAVEVRARRLASRGTGVGLFFSRVLGISQSDVEVRSVAQLDVPVNTGGLPMALRAPGFGPVDDEILEANPGKDGPSEPANGVSFLEGEKVTIYIYGKGTKAPVHLTLDIDSPATSSSSESDVKDALRGGTDPMPVALGDEVYVLNDGTGSNSFGTALDDRLDYDVTHEIRDVIVPIVDIIPGESRVYVNDGQEWNLSGKVKVVDFVGLHIDGVENIWVTDPDKPDHLIKTEVIVGTVRKVMGTNRGSGNQPSGAGGNTVRTVRLVQ
ncbi:MAG: hypothetical protein HYS13_12570, partial [Planctomycetia bacterium]|nr:hypothetical protein [Planctomycetia bacterium]